MPNSIWPPRARAFLTKIESCHNSSAWLSLPENRVWLIFPYRGGNYVFCRRCVFASSDHENNNKYKLNTIFFTCLHIDINISALSKPQRCAMWNYYILLLIRSQYVHNSNLKVTFKKNITASLCVVCLYIADTLLVQGFSFSCNIEKKHISPYVNSDTLIPWIH